ncbi:ferredoxin [Microgenomates group bacterium]|nr:ferredoxin [Microgenomates group bacterium]
MSKKITHRFSDCIGCGACISISPEHFSLNPQTFKANLIDGQLDESDPATPVQTLTTDSLDDSTADLLTISCPANIIAIEDLT